MRFNGALFSYKYDNLQLNVLNATKGANELVDGVKADMKGLELEINAAFTDNLSGFASTTLMDAKYTSNAFSSPLFGPRVQLQVIKGNKVTQTPNAVVIAGFDYRLACVQQRDSEQTGQRKRACFPLLRGLLTMCL